MREACVVLVTCCVIFFLSVTLVGLPSIVTAENPEANGADRILSNDVVAPGGEITVETTVAFEDPTSGVLTESVDPAVDGIVIDDDDGADEVTVDDDHVSFTFTDRTSVTVTYTLEFDQSVDDGDTFEIEGVWDNGDTVELPESTVTVSDGPIFEVEQLEIPERVPPGQGFDVALVINNTGSETDTQTVELSLDSSTLRESDPITLGPGEQQSLVFEDVTIDDPGVYALAIETEQHLRSHNITVESFARFDVEMIDAPQTVADVDEFVVTAVVSNTGDLSATQDIRLQVNDDTITVREDVTIEPGQSQLISFDPIRIDETGIHTLRVMTDDSDLTRTISVVEAEVSARFEDQLIGTDTGGNTAVYIEEVTADQGWSIVLTYENETGVSIVAGMYTFDEPVEDGFVSVPIEDSHAYPGTMEAHVAIDTDDVTIGEPLPETVERLLTDSASVFEISIDLYDQSFDDATSTITVSAAALFDAPDSGATPYIIALYRDAGDGLEIVGQSNPIWGAEQDIEIALDRSLDIEGDHEMIARVHYAVVGQRGEPIHMLDGSSPSTVDEPVTVRIVNTPSFTIQGVNRDASVTAGETLNIEITVMNEGVAAGSKSLWVSAGAWVELVDITLDPGETKTVSVSWPTTSDDIGEVTLLVDSGDDQELSTLSIETPSETETPSDGDPIPGFGLAIGVLSLVILSYALSRRYRP